MVCQFLSCQNHVYSLSHLTPTGENIIQSSKDKVSRWLQDFEECSTSPYETISKCSDLAEHPQYPDMSDNTSKLQ